MKKIAALTSVIGLALVTTGCNVGEVDENGHYETDGNMNIEYVDLKDGREIPCIYTSTSPRAGLSCDWEGERK